MKMKSNVFGYSAKLALAVLAVCGTLFTSCYESEELDNTGGGGTVKPLDPAKYLVAGSITNGSNGAIITNATVKVDNAPVTATNGTFSVEAKPGFIKIEVTADGFLDNETMVYVQPAQPGETSVGIADIALFDAGSQSTPALVDPETPSLSSADENKVKNLLTVTGDVELEKTDDGYIATENIGVDPTTDDMDVTYEYKEGFELLGDPIASRAISDKDQFIANVAKIINRSYGLRTVTGRTHLSSGGNTIIGYKVVITVFVKEYSFSINSKIYTGTACWNRNVKVVPVLDTHDSHDPHGGGNNAGGGDGGSNNN